MDDQRRRLDRTEKDWGEGHVSSMIDSRIGHAAPGDVLNFRKGTGVVDIDKVNQVTWENVFAELCELGILKELGEGRYRKLKDTDTDRHGVRPQKLRWMVRDLLVNRQEEEVGQLDIIHSREDLSQFIMYYLVIEKRKSSFEYGCPDLSEGLTMAVEGLVNYYFPRMADFPTSTDEIPFFYESVGIVRSTFKGIVEEEYTLGDIALKWGGVIAQKIRGKIVATKKMAPTNQ